MIDPKRRRYFLTLVRHTDKRHRAHGHAGLGDIEISRGEPLEAVRHLRQAVRLAPLEPQYHYLLGFAFGQMKRWREAASALERATRLEPRRAEYLRCLGWVLCNSEQLERGRGMLSMAHELDPQNAHILADLASSYLITKEYETARRYAMEARALAPDDPLIQSLDAMTERAAPAPPPPRDKTLKQAVNRMTEAAQRAGRPGLVMSTQKWKTLVSKHFQDLSTAAFAKDIISKIGEPEDVEELQRWLDLGINIWNNTPQPDRAGKSAIELYEEFGGSADRTL
jgi:Flp pilus assembly protein TadD